MAKQASAKRTAIFALSILVVIWGYNWVVMKVGVHYSSPIDFATLRVVLGAISLFLVLVWLRKPLLPEEILGTFLTGILQTSGVYGFSMWALASGGAGKTAVLNYTMPLWVLLFAWLVLGERLRRVQWVGVVLASAGLLFILLPFNLAEGLTSKGLAILSGISWALGIVVTKKLQQKTSLDLLSFTTWQMIFGSIPLILAAVFVPTPPITWSVPLILALVYNVIPGSAIAWLLWFYALSRLPAGTAGLGTLATPVVGVLAAWIQLGEKPKMLESIGMLLIVVALILNSIQILKHHQAS